MLPSKFDKMVNRLAVFGVLRYALTGNVRKFIFARLAR